MTKAYESDVWTGDGVGDADRILKAVPRSRQDAEERRLARDRRLEYGVKAGGAAAVPVGAYVAYRNTPVSPYTKGGIPRSLLLRRGARGRAAGLGLMLAGPGAILAENKTREARREQWH